MAIEVRALEPGEDIGEDEITVQDRLVEIEEELKELSEQRSKLLCERHELEEGSAILVEEGEGVKEGEGIEQVPTRQIFITEGVCGHTFIFKAYDLIEVYYKSAGFYIHVLNGLEVALQLGSEDANWKIQQGYIMPVDVAQKFYPGYDGRGWNRFTMMGNKETRVTCSFFAFLDRTPAE